MRTWVTIFLLFSFILKVNAQLKLPALISDNMCLQQNTEVNIWGWDRAGQEVEIIASWTSKSIKAITAANGKWLVKLKTPKAGGTFEIKIQGSETIIIKNILIGEVWLCSGQSNMGKALGLNKRQKPVINFYTESQKADYPEIRLFKLRSKISSMPLEDCEGKWVICSPETALSFSAVGFFFGKNLHNNLHVPVGLIQSTWGGSPVEAWTKKDAMNNDEIISRFENYESRFESDKEYYEKSINDFNSGLLLREPEMPESVYFTNNPQKGISVLYNGMISPLLNFRIAGVIWYQGEANVSNPDQYKLQFSNLINTWRADWNIGDFAFYFVQIAPFMYDEISGAAKITEAQCAALELKNTGIASTQDIGNLYDIHPPEKSEVGRRLSLIALNQHYGFKELSYAGPTMKDVAYQNGKLVINFEPNGGELFFSGDYGGRTSFYISSDNKIFYAAISSLEGNSIMLSHPDVESPMYVRYLWFNDSNPTVFNTLGLPAISFRTDSWDDVVYKSGTH